MGKRRVAFVDGVAEVGESYSERGSAFEENVRKVLKRLGFDNVKGGSDFNIGKYQIDAYGECDGKLVIIECSTMRGEYKAKLNQIRGSMADIRRSLSLYEEYKKYDSPNKVRFIFATNSNKFNISEYAEFQTGENRICLWDKKLVEYYKNISSEIYSRAKYDVLADLGFETEKTEKLTVPAFEYTYRNMKLYCFVADPEDLIKISYVARRESGGMDYYQRMINMSRLKKINDFLMEGNIFPTNIVLGINDKYKFTPYSSEINKDFDDKTIAFGELSLPRKYDSCWVIDGQHRLFSFTKGMAQRVFVLAMANVDRNHQARFFLQINENAKPIKAELIWDLQGDLNPTGQEGILSNAVKRMNTIDPFKGHIQMPSSGKGAVSIASFCDSLMKLGFANNNVKSGIKGLHKVNPYFNTNPENFSLELASGISTYYKNIIDLIKPEKSFVKEFVLDNGGVSVFNQVFKMLICISNKKIDKNLVDKFISPIIEYLEAAGKSNLIKFRKRCTSESGKKEVLDELLTIIKDKDTLIHEFIGASNSSEDVFKEIERKLRELIYFELKDRKWTDLQGYLNKTLLEKVSSRMRSLSGDDEIHKFSMSLSLGEALQVIFDTPYLWNTVFKKIFVRPQEDISVNDPRFVNESQFRALTENLTWVRNRLEHPNNIVVTKHDERSAMETANRLNMILDSQSET